MLTDLRAAWRGLLGARWFTTVALTTLTLGATLVVTLASVANGYLIRGLPYPAADRLYRIEYAAPGQRPPDGLETLDWASLSDIVEHDVAWDLDVFYLMGGEYPEASPGAWVTPGYLRALGIRASTGRVFDPGDYAPGAPAVALISHRLWRSRFGGADDVVGRQFAAYVSDRPDEPERFTIVGVLPDGLWHFNAYTEVLVPLRAPTYPYMARLRPDVPPQSAVDRIAALVRRGLPGAPRDWQPTLTSQHASYVAGIRPVLAGIAAGVALVCLIAAANVAVLMLLRGRQRQKEVAIHLALGATQARLARRLGLEGAILGASSTAAGVLLSVVAMRTLAPSIERVLGRRVPGGVAAFDLDMTVIGLAALSGLIVTVVFTLAPLIDIDRGESATAFLRSDRTTTDGRRLGRARSVLIGLEVSASVALVSAAALITVSLVAMLRVDFGIDVARVVTASVGLRQQAYPDEAARGRFYERLLARLESLDGPDAVAIGDWWPLQQSRTRLIEAGDGSASATTTVLGVAGRYFDALGIPVLAGRPIDATDRLGSAPVVVLSASLARRLWPQGPAVGRQVTLAADGARPGESSRATVVGVVGDVRQTHGDVDVFDAYMPLAHNAVRFAYLYVRDPAGRPWDATLRTAVAAIDREVALGASRALSTAIDDERTRPRFLTVLLTACAVFASALALIGIATVVAYSARHRRREIAVRLALGATPLRVSRLFVRQTAGVLTAGAVGGVVAAAGLGRILQGQLFGVSAGEPTWHLAAASLLVAAGLVAAWWPSWRATSLDPARLLAED